MARLTDSWCSNRKKAWGNCKESRLPSCRRSNEKLETILPFMEESQSFLCPLPAVGQQFFWLLALPQHLMQALNQMPGRSGYRGNKWPCSPKGSPQCQGISNAYLPAVWVPAGTCSYLSQAGCGENPCTRTTEYITAPVWWASPAVWCMTAPGSHK